MHAESYRCGEEVRKDPTWDEVESAIRKLRGDDLHIAGPDTASMTIGGADDRFFAQITLDGDYFHYLLGPNRSNDLVSITVGNQGIEMEQRKISNLESVLRAARVFAETGKVDDSLDWELG